MSLPKRGILTQLWTVHLDHSLGGTFRTRREAREYKRLHNSHENPMFILGPWRLCIYRRHQS